MRSNILFIHGGGPTAVINCSLWGVISEAGRHGELEHLYAAVGGTGGFLREQLTDLRDVSEDELARLCSTPGSAIGTSRDALEEADYHRMADLADKYGLKYIVMNGGNGTMDACARLNEACRGRGIGVIGLPKTMDNDLMHTDHTPGYGSAAKYIAASMQEILRDCAVYTVKAVTIVEIMGRDAGWLTTSASLGRLANGQEPDLVYLPEKPFCMDEFIESTKKALEKHPNVVVAVSEGIRFADGTYVGAGAQSGVKDVFGHQYLAGTGKALEYAVRERIGCKVRSVELNVSQRCAAHLVSAADIAESVAIGRAAALAAEQGESGKMMLYKRVSQVPYAYEIDCADVHEIANKIKRVPDEYINEQHNGITDACLEYLRPLVEGERYPKYVCGLPEQVIL